MLILPSSTQFQQTSQGATEAFLSKIPKLKTVFCDVRRRYAVVIRYFSKSPNVSNTREQFIYYGTIKEMIEDWFVYGAFSTVPSQFRQLYTIHGTHHVRNVVGTYCLLRSKYWETYTDKLRQLKHLTNNVIPHSIMIDFYQGIIVALNQEYPLVQQNVWVFHVSRSIYWYDQELGLSRA